MHYEIGRDVHSDNYIEKTNKKKNDMEVGAVEFWKTKQNKTQR